jgi:hypothetical protein
VGNIDGFANMFVDDKNCATSFIVSTGMDRQKDGYPINTLENLFPQFGIPGINFIKIDVDGFELEVLSGARSLINRFQPIVLLEMNHWCLNVFRRISIPEFHERVLAFFPAVFAVHDTEVVDFTDPANIGRIFHEHIIHNRFMNIVAGFNRDELLRRLANLHAFMPQPEPVSLSSLPTELDSAPKAEPLIQRLAKRARRLLPSVDHSSGCGRPS